MVNFFEPMMEFVEGSIFIFKKNDPTKSGKIVENG